MEQWNNRTMKQSIYEKRSKYKYKPLNILIFSPLYPPQLGGLESHADEFNEHLAKKGVKITVFTPHLNKEAPEREIKYKKVNIIRFPAREVFHKYSLPKIYKLQFWKLFKNLFKENYAITISRTRFFSTSLLALFYKIITLFTFNTKPAWVHIEHSSDFLDLNNKLLNFLTRGYDYTLGKLVISSANQVVANSEASRKFCQKLAPRKKVKVIYRGVKQELIEKVRPDYKTLNLYQTNLNNSRKNYCLSEIRSPIGDRISSSLSYKNKLSNNKIILAFIGRLIISKGAQDLLRALKSIDKNIRKDLILLVIGYGPYKKSLEELTKKLNLQKQVVFCGYKKQKETISLLKTADIYINPSHAEGLPTSVIEAALCKKAIIATNIGGTPEIITHKKEGLLIPPRAPQELKKALEKLIKEKNLRNKLSKNAYQEVKNKFDWERSSEEYLRLFTNLN